MKQAAIIIGIVLAVTGLSWWILETMDAKKGGTPKGKDGPNFEDFHGRGPGSDKLKIEDVVVGNGKTASAGDMVTVHYTGRLASGTKFDSSLDRGTASSRLARRSHRGWDQGVI